MSVARDGVEDSVIGRLVTRLREETPKIDATTVERALAAKQAAKMTRRARSQSLEEDTAQVRTRPVSRSLGGEEAIPVEQKWPYAGLAPMTRVRTSFGDVYAVALRRGDLVKTRSGEFKPIVWLDRIMLDDTFLQTMKDSNPILMPEGSVARGLPKKDILVSPRQVVSMQADFCEQREAADLLGRPNIRRKFETGMSYTVFHLGRTEEVSCEGLWLRIEI
jgi:hypothetical protein